MKNIKKYICTFLAFASLLSLFPTAYAENAQFYDLETDYVCYEPVIRLCELGIINGYEDGSYKPWNNVTRAEFSKIIVAMMDKTVEAKSTPPSSAFDDVNNVSWCIPYVNYLTSNGIIKGYADATFKPNNIITYAEAVTIICRLLGYTDENIGYNWPANYINQAEALNLSEDMDFSAEDSITRSAAAIIVDNAMFTYVQGKEDTTFLESIGYKVYENSYIVATSKENSDVKSDELQTSQGIFENISKNASDMIGRKGILVLNENNRIVLFMPENSVSIFDSLSTKDDYLALEKIGYTVIENCFIAATKAEESSLTAFQIRTSSGVYEVENTEILDKVKCIGTLILNSAGRAAIFAEDSFASMDVTVTKLTGSDTIEYKATDGSKNTFAFNNNFVVYYDNNKSTYQATSQQITVGTRLTFYGDAINDWSFVTINSTADNVVPVRATKNYNSSDTHLEGIPISYDGLTVYKDNKTVAVSDIEINDVIYYDTATNIMDVYTKKISGIYNSAMPSKAYVTSINVGGKEYQLNKDIDTSKLDASEGSFEIGERITLLLGKNDEVCFAVELTGFNTLDYGVLLKTYKEISASGDNEGSSQIMASIYMPDGNTYEYRTKSDYKSYIGDLIKINYEANNMVSLSKADNSKIYGDLNVSARTLGNKTVLKDVIVFNRLSEEEADTADVELLDFNKLNVTSISIDQLITSVSANAFGDIAILYLANMPSSYNFGIYRGDNGSDEKEATIYRMYTNGNNVEYIIDARFSVSSGPVMYKTNGNSISYMKSLKEIASYSSVDAIEGGRIMLNGNVYKMDDNVLIVDSSDITSYKTLSVNELSGMKTSSVRLFSESNASTASTVRIIMVR